MLASTALPVQSAAANSSYAVAQGTSCTVVSPIDGGDENVSSFYDYRNPDTTPDAATYSSYGTTELQESRGSVLVFYEGAEGTSMVLIHDKLGDEVGGSTATFQFSGLPEGEWAVEDDRYEDEDGEPQDDDWETDGSDATIHWKWKDNRTDGGAYRGLDAMDTTIVIDARFNEEAAHWGDEDEDWKYSGSDEYRMTSWTLVDGNETQAGSLELDRRVFVHHGGCEVTPPSASVDGPDTSEVGTNVTFDASGTTDDGAIGGYEWDFDGDGEIDEVTIGATTTRAYDSPGSYEVNVTAFDTYGNSDNASTTVTVEPPDTTPNASLTGPDVATVNETVTLNASESTDDGDIVEYRWDLNGSGTVDRNTTVATISHSYSSEGNVSPAVTVVDDNGTSDTANVTITVEDADTTPNASLSAPGKVVVNATVTLDASNSSDDREIVEYRWDFGGDDAIDANTTEPTVDYTYTSPGEVEPTVTVADSANQTNTTSTVVNVTEPVDLQPDIDVSSTSATTGDTVSFDASASRPEDRITEYRWEFGDDATGTGATATHSYEGAGEYTVRLRVTTDAGQTANTTTTVSVAAASSGGGGDGGDDGDDGDGGDGGSSGTGSGGGGGGSGDSAPRTDDSSQSDSTTPPEPDVSTVSVSTDSRTLIEGETFVVDATVTNHGNATGTKTIEFAVEGTLVTERTFSIDPNETRTVTFTHRFTSPGTKSIQIDHGEPFEVRVEPASPDIEVTALRADPATVDVGQDIRFSATVSNTGHAEGSRTVELQLFGETVDVKPVTLEPGAETTVTFTRSIDAPGTYEAVVANESVEVQVGGHDGPPTTQTGEGTRAETPGFGLFAALTAVILTALVISRRD